MFMYVENFELTKITTWAQSTKLITTFNINYLLLTIIKNRM